MDTSTGTPSPASDGTPTDFLAADAYDHAASVRWAGKVGARPKFCYWNALMALRESRGAVGVYVEGFVLSTYGLVLAHGWVETPDGKVIDPTFPVCEGNEPSTPYRYMPALRFTYEQLKGKRAERFPLHCDGGKNFRKEREQPWAGVMQAAYAARNRLEAVTADEGD